MQKNLFFKFTSGMSFYYMSYSVVMGYAALFMQYKHFTNTQIGIVLACSAVLCILLQIFSGSFLDVHPEISVRIFLLVSGFLVIFSASILYFASQKWLIFICYTVIGSLMLANSSLFNSFGMEYINCDVRLNYSLSRGICSILYAGVSLITGVVIKHLSVMVIFPTVFVLQSIMLLILFCLKPSKRISKSQKIQNQTKDKKAGSSDNFISFFKRNPAILFLLLSILLIYISYTSINNFHINIIKSAGGTSQELGISISLASMLELPAMALFLPLSKKISYRNLLCISCAFFFLKATCMFFAGNMIQVYLSQCLQFFSYGLFIPSSAYFINSILSVQDKIKGQSALGIFTFGLSGLFSSLFSGMILDHFSVKTMLGLESCLAFTGLLGVIAACHILNNKHNPK